MVIDLLHFTGALLLMAFIGELFCAIDRAEIASPIAMNKIDFEIMFVVLFNDTNVCSKNKAHF